MRRRPGSRRRRSRRSRRAAAGTTLAGSARSSRPTSRRSARCRCRTRSARRFRDGYMYVTTTEGLTVYDVDEPGAAGAGRRAAAAALRERGRRPRRQHPADLERPERGRRRPVRDRHLRTRALPDAEVGHAERLHRDRRPGDLRPARSRRRPASGTPRRASRPTASSPTWRARAAGSRSWTCATRRTPKKAGRFDPGDHRPRLARRAGGREGARVDRRAPTGPRPTTCSDPLNPKMVMRTDETIMNSGQLGFPGPDPVFGIGGEGETPIDLIHHDSLRLRRRRSLRRRKSESSRRTTTDRRARARAVPDLGTDKRIRRRKLALLDMFDDGAREPGAGQGWAPVTGLCSAHYFDERDGLVASGWYEEGTRFLDVRDPAGIRQVGYWVPTKGETWSVYFAPTDPSGVDRVRARLRARHRRAPLRPLGDTRARRAPCAARLGAGARPPVPGAGAARTS